MLGLVVAWLALLLILWLIRPRGVGARELARLVPDILRVLLVWLISPIDLVPEFIPVLGPLDDVIVAVVILRFVRHRLGDTELRRRWRGTDDGWVLLERILAGRRAPAG